ncbi:MAG: nucleotide pyrophosphohydrolase [Anaerolineae bacterium]|nr:nucleotide pyrophosphohydrolase [Anaerolineae bacterium]
MDDQTSVADLCAFVEQFVAERQWQPYHDPKNLSASIAIEAAELVEIYQWLDNAQARAAGRDPGIRQRTREELADVLIYCLSLANALAIDLSEAIRDKMAANALKYPADAVRGKLGPTPVEDTSCPLT